MERPEYTDNDGCVREGKAKLLPWGNSTAKMNIGLTKNQFKKGYDICVARCAEIAEWYDVNKSTRVRNAADALKLLTSDHWHSNRVIGYSHFHHKTITKDDIKTAEYEDSIKYGIPSGDPFVAFPKLLKSGYKGDDAPMANWPTICKSKTTGGIWGFFWKKGVLAHSRFSHLSTINSGEGVHSWTVRYEILKQMSVLSKLQYVVFWSWINGSWICIPHRHCSGFDWPFECTIGGLLG